MKKSDNINYELSKYMVIFLFIYYIIILVGGLICSVIIMVKSAKPELNKETLLLYTVYVSLAISGMFCGIQYTKRLYKA